MHLDEDDQQMLEIGRAIVGIIEECIRSGTPAHLPFSYNYPAMGLAQDFDVYITPKGPAVSTGTVQ